jgi:hypothetical protein
VLIPSTAKAVTGSGVISATPAAFRGLSVKDTSAAGNTVKIFDNPSTASGTIIFEKVLASGGDVTFTDPAGIRGATGLYLSTTGSVEGSVWIS